MISSSQITSVGIQTLRDGQVRPIALILLQEEVEHDLCPWGATGWPQGPHPLGDADDQDLKEENGNPDNHNLKEVQVNPDGHDLIEDQVKPNDHHLKVDQVEPNNHNSKEKQAG